MREYKFFEGRKFRFDFAWKKQKVAVEIEGGIWIRGAHTRGKHFVSDCDKYNLAALNGWRVFRFTSEHLKNLADIQWILCDAFGLGQETANEGNTND